MNILEAFGRIFISFLFLYEAARKFFYQVETIDYMESYGVSKFLFYPSLLFELIFPILLIIGFKTRIALDRRPAVTAKKGASLAPNRITITEPVSIGIDI